MDFAAATHIVGQGASPTSSKELGLTLTPVPLTELQAVSKKFRGGLRVSSVSAGSLAAKQGIRPEDVLVGIHVWETVSLDNLRYILEKADLTDHDSVPFYIIRGGKTMSGHFAVSQLKTSESLR